MLQQTTVAAVMPRFERFLDRWPTVEALAAAPDEEVMREWAGLGYYARARNLLKAARQVAAAGSFPATAAELRQLPGVGDYTAAAIAAIAFGAPEAAVDTNVARVVSRLHGLPEPSLAEVRNLVTAMIPAGHPGDFTQAMMDLGATICRPRAPLCETCPLTSDCAAFASGHPEVFPRPKAKTARPQRHGIAYWIERDGRVWLTRRPASGLLGGMAALPGPEWSHGAPPITDALVTVRHVFTHFTLDLSIVRRASAEVDGWWHEIGDIDAAGLPTLYRKACHAALAVSSAEHVAPDPLERACAAP